MAEVAVAAKAGAAALKSGTDQALAFLAAGKADSYLEASLVKYSVGRFQIGLGRFADILDRIGCKPGASLLDMGCGAGNWSIAHAIRSESRAPTLAVDRREGFVQLGRDVGELLGLGNLTFRAGSAEDGAMYGEDRAREYILANGFLMFVNADKVLDHMTRAIVPGGGLYGNYTTAAGRIAAALVGVEKKTIKAVTAGMTHVMGSVQASIGLKPKLSSFGLTGEDVRELFAVWGFRLREIPRVHDWGATLASEGVVDFIMDYDGKKASRPPERLLAIGAQQAVIDATADDSSAAALDLRARATMGRQGSAAAKALVDRLPAGAPARLVFIAQQAIDGAMNAPDALAALAREKAPDSEPHLPAFLAGIVALQAGEAAAAERSFAEVSRMKPAWLGGWGGQVLALCYKKTEPDAPVAAAFARMVQHAEFGLTAQDEGFRRRAAALA